MEYLSENDELLSFELKKWDEGFSFVTGIDEVGRGPLAGPVVAAAVIFPKGSKIPFVDDSKKLSEKKRNEIKKTILSVDGVQYAIVEISPEEIDKLNILRASQLAMKKAVGKLKDADYALIDGLPVPGFPLVNEAIVKGDSKSASIAAASILAKVYRDKLMEKVAEKYPEYGFEKHKGYGTKLHLKALNEHGPCPIHRRSFAPVKEAAGEIPVQMELF